MCVFWACQIVCERLEAILLNMCVSWSCLIECETWHARFLCELNRVRSVVSSDEKMWYDFFFKHQNQLFLKSNSNKHRCRPNQDSEERVLRYLEYNSEVILLPTKLWLANPQEKRSKSHKSSNDQKREPLSLYFVSSMTNFLSFVGCFRSKPSEPTELIQYCIIFYTTRTVDLNSYKLTTGMNL